MTTGSWVQGDPSGKSFHTRDWTGDDNFLSENRYWGRHVVGSREATKCRTTLGCWDASLDVPWPTMSLKPEPPNAQLQTLQKASDILRGHGLDLGNSIAEGRQAVNSAVSALNSIGQAAVALKRGNFTGAARAFGFTGPLQTIPARRGRLSKFREHEVGRVAKDLTKQGLGGKDIANQWLSLAYGWLPLMEDTFQAASEWELITSQPRRWELDVRKSWRDEFSASDATAGWSIKRKYANTARIKFTEELTLPRSLGLLDPLGMAWEVTPWSFVVDWFIPVGDYLDVLSVFPHLNATVSWTTFARNDASLQKPVWPAGTLPGDSISGSGSYVWVETGRSPRQSLVVPRPKFVPLQDVMSPRRLANAIALAAQRMLGGGWTYR